MYCKKAYFVGIIAHLSRIFLDELDSVWRSNILVANSYWSAFINNIWFFPLYINLLNILFRHIGSNCRAINFTLKLPHSYRPERLNKNKQLTFQTPAVRVVVYSKVCEYLIFYRVYFVFSTWSVTARILFFLFCFIELCPNLVTILVRCSADTFYSSSNVTNAHPLLNSV